MAVAKERLAESICRHIDELVDSDQGTANKEVLLQLVARMRALLRRHRWQEAVDVAYHIMIARNSVSKQGALNATAN